MKIEILGTGTNKYVTSTGLGQGGAMNFDRHQPFPTYNNLRKYLGNLGNVLQYENYRTWLFLVLGVGCTCVTAGRQIDIDRLNPTSSLEGQVRDPVPIYPYTVVKLLVRVESLSPSGTPLEML